MSETGVKGGKNLHGDPVPRNFIQRGTVRRQGTRYCCDMKDRIAAGQATDAAVGEQRAALREQIYGLSEPTLDALEEAARGEEPRKSKVVQDVARQLGVTVGAILGELQSRIHG